MRFFSCSLLLILFFSCSKAKDKRNQLIDFVPKSSQIIVKTTHLESLKNNLENNAFLNTLSKTSNYKDLERRLRPLSNFNADGEALICLSKSQNDSLQYTFITKYSKTLFQTDSLQNYIEETLKYKNKSITKSKLESDEFYSTIIDSVFIVSSSKNSIDSLYISSEKNSEFEKMYAVSGKNENVSVLLKTNNSFTPSFFIEDALKTSELTDFLTLDTEIIQDDILINGIAKSADSSKKILDIFKNTVPQENQTQHIAPSNSDGFLSFTFDNFEVFNSNLKHYHHRDSITTQTQLFDNIIEVGLIYEDNQRAVVLNSVDVIATQDALLSEQNKIETYRDIDIFNFSKTNLFTDTFKPLISTIETSKYCTIDSYFVFANSIEQLQNIIANYQNKTTLSSRTHYTELSKNLSSASSLLLVSKPDFLEKISSKNLKGNHNLNLNSYALSATQFIYDSNFAHVHGALIKSKKRGVQNSVSETFNIKLDADLLNTPQFVTNHVSKQKEIVVQDINNNLYLISNKGKVLWKKRLNGAILGPIAQIDMYKNGRLQLAFTTPHSLYVLDRKGRTVSPFPMKFNDEITQPLSVFDYDKNKKYRLLITQGKNVLMYDARGQIVKGFTFKTANGDILSPPKHFRIGSKDYLALKTKNKLYILDRTGKMRLSPKIKSDLSKEPIFLHQNKFTTTTSNGKLISVDTRGNTSEVNLNLTSNHNLETTSKTRVTFHDNKLGIKSRVLELDYGNYSRPRIFYINDKIYVAITDLQAKKVYLYDSQGQLRPNFPVYGNSAIHMENIDADSNLEFVVKGDNNIVLLYQIN
ncbi:ribonuclease HII [Algibacter sp. 2305UL17-15]|uniref:ribonuclease HII n=1 Tax=Algibacter sp. 2305UL17-15 TaxID=3231268 RepID=UPI0034598F5B